MTRRHYNDYHCHPCGRYIRPRRPSHPLNPRVRSVLPLSTVICDPCFRRSIPAQRAAP